MNQRRSGRKLVGGLVTMAVAVAVVLAGGGLALALGAANPPADRVLRDARHFLGTATSVGYSATVTVTSAPLPDGSRRVRSRQVSGTDAFGRGWDFHTVEGANVAEYRLTADSAGLLVRGSVSPAPLGVRWTRYASLEAFERSTATAGANGTVSEADVLAAMLGDDLSNAANITVWLAAASDPRRASGHRKARHVTVALDASKGFADQGGLVTAATADLDVGTDGHLQTLSVDVSEGLATFAAHYVFTPWDHPLAVATPQPADVVAP
jgi:hypothetical protein